MVDRSFPCVRPAAPLLLFILKQPGRAVNRPAPETGVNRKNGTGIEKMDQRFPPVPVAHFCYSVAFFQTCFPPLAGKNFG
jgi:hypothetical protein